MKSIRRFRHPKRIAIIGVLIVAAVTIGILYAYFSSTSKTQGEPVITFSTDRPDESKQNADAYTWRGADNEPKRIIIPSIDVRGIVQAVGVDQNREVAVPDNVHLAGWFVDSVRPGEKGLSIIVGHVSGRQNDGIFSRLESLAVGDFFSVELGSGEEIAYEVIDAKAVPLAEAASVMFSQDPRVASQLNLVTCIGQYLYDQQTYEDRLVVMAQRL